MITLLRESKSDTDVQNSLLDSVGEGKSRMMWEIGTETCEISCVKQNKTTTKKMIQMNLSTKQKQANKNKLMVTKGEGGG